MSIKPFVIGGAVGLAAGGTVVLVARPIQKEAYAKSVKEWDAGAPQRQVKTDASNAFVDDVAKRFGDTDDVKIVDGRHSVSVFDPKHKVEAYLETKGAKPELVGVRRENIQYGGDEDLITVSTNAQWRPKASDGHVWLGPGYGVSILGTVVGGGIAGGLSEAGKLTPGLKKLFAASKGVLAGSLALLGASIVGTIVLGPDVPDAPSL